MERKKNISLKTRVLYEGVAICLLLFVVWHIRQNRITEAGTITPPASVGVTMDTAQEVYDAIASSTYNSSGVTSTLNGNILQVSKCLIDKVNGSPCD